MVDYRFEDIKKAYRKLGIQKGRVLFVESDLACLGTPEVMDKNKISEAHLRALSELVGKTGTIVVATTSYSLCNTNIPFDPKKTPSEIGIFSEYVRCQRGAVRSFHPFVSFSAIGKKAHKICDNVSRHAYGPGTPLARMREEDSLFISIGLHPRHTCRILQEAEMGMGVPYRYVKEFIHPVVRSGRVRKEPFYLYVWYYVCRIKKNTKDDFWADFESGAKVKEATIGRGKAYSYSMCEFYRFAIRLFKNNLFTMLEEIPDDKPYQRTM